MSDFRELIKSFPKTREYIRDFFVYGFKTREEFKEKSPRTYDNERRRLESWLGPYVQRDYVPGGSNISLGIDSNLLDTNPLFRVWKTKSFTDNDIVLHFLILDLLQDGRALTAEEITECLLTDYENLFDSQTVRRKCNDYAKEGMLSKKKTGKTVVYSLDTAPVLWMKSNEGALDALAFFQMAECFCIVGNELSEQLDSPNRCFRALLQAQKNRQYAEINYTAPGGKRGRHFYLPARLEYSVKNDKFRLLALTPAGRHKPGLVTLNVARIQSVRPAEKRLSPPVDLNAVIQASYYKEPLRLRIVNRRNALERAMLHFANYEKTPEK